jgi:multiple sugar transport system ATP-binding protein
VQVDEPQRLYDAPRDLFVAGFIGSPAMNLVEAEIDGGDVVFGQYRVPGGAVRTTRRSGPVVLGIRPEAFEDASFAPSTLPQLVVQIEVVEELGSEAHVFFRAETASAAGLADVQEPEEDATLLADDRAILAARVDARSRARVGEPLALAVDASRFHFFDRETGDSLALTAPTRGIDHLSNSALGSRA